MLTTSKSREDHLNYKKDIWKQEVRKRKRRADILKLIDGQHSVANKTNVRRKRLLKKIYETFIYSYKTYIHLCDLKPGRQSNEQNVYRPDTYKPYHI